MPKTYPTNFVGDFLLGDNIKENLDALTVIWNVEDKRGIRSVRKPIIVLCAAIIEAILHDFFFRIKEFTREGVDRIEREFAEFLRSKDNDNLQFFIDQSRKHQLFGDGSDGLYKNLDKLAELRNRIHIQNVKLSKPDRECDAFTQDYQKMAEKTLEGIIRHMVNDYNRKQEDHVGGFTLPWDSHFQ